MAFYGVALFPEGRVTGTEVLLAQDLLQCELGSIDIVTNSAAALSSALPRQYSAAASFASQPAFHDLKFLGSLARHLQPNACLTLVQPQVENTDEITKNLILSGFVKATVDDQRSAAGNTVVTASMPSFSPGAGAALTLKRKQQPAATAVPLPSTSTATSTWTIAVDHAEDELIDDDALLTEEDLAPAPVYSKKADDCEVGAGRKACKDCTCGRAEQEATTDKPTQAMLDNPTSSCGNCYLGDAFRCGGCPYRGLPAFEANKKIELPSHFLVADA